MKMTCKQVAAIIDDATRELAEDNDKAERKAALDAMVAQVKADAAKLQANYRKVLPNGAALTVAQEVKLMRESFPMVAVKD